MRRPPIQTGTRVAIDIGQGLATARGIVTAAKYDDGWTYRIDITDGDRCESHRDGGELWVCDFEIAETSPGPGCEFCREPDNQPDDPNWHCPYCGTKNVRS